MKQHWQSEPIGSLCQLVNGRAFKPSEWTQNGLPIVRIQNLNDETKPFNYYDGEIHSKYLVKDGDVLLSWSGTPGTSFGCFGWNRGQAILNQHIFKVFVDTTKMLKEFFVYAVNSRLDEMISLAHGGVGLRHITKKKLERIDVPVPPIEEQRRIVRHIQEFLKRVGEIRGLRHTIIQEAEALSVVLLDSLRDESWPSDLVERLTTEIRNGWSGRTWPNGCEARVLRLSCVRGIRINTADAKKKFVPPHVIDRFSLRSGDVFLVRGNGTKRLVGRAAISDSDYPGVIFNDLLIRLRFRDRILPEFATIMGHTPYVRYQIEDLAKTAAGIWKINQRMVRKLRFPCPPLTEQEKAIQQFTRIRKVLDEINTNMSAADPDALTRAVLRKSFTGEL